MRILYSFPHAVGRSGIGTTAFHQLQGLLRLDVEVLVYCTSLESKLEGAHAVTETLSFAGRRVPHRLLGVGRAYRFHDHQVASALRGLGRSIDVVHCWPSAAVKTITAARTAAIRTAREVPNTHTGYAFEVVARETRELGIAPVKGHSHTFVEASLEREEEEYRLADILLVPSDFSKRTFLARGLPPEKLALHAYGFDPRRFYPNRSAEGLKRCGRGLRAVFVGGCEPRKGLHYALQAWVDSGAASHGRFVICGAFVKGYREAIAPLLRHPSVEVRGFVDDPAELMRQSDVLIFPSIEEGSALVTYEAQACGCALLVSEASGARCDHGQQGLIHTPGDLRTLTEHLRLIDSDPALLLRMREAAVANSRQLTWDHAAEGLLDIYREVTGG